MNQAYDHIWRIWLYIFSVFLYFFRWILLNLLSRPADSYVTVLQKCQLHFSSQILILLFLFQEFDFLFPCFSENCRKLQFSEIFSSAFMPLCRHQFFFRNPYKPFHLLSTSFSLVPCSFPCFYIFFIFFFLVSRFFILFCLPFPVRFPSMLPYSVQFLYSFPFSILLLISSQVPFILLGWFFKTPYKPFAGPYRALKRLKA